uniref:Uncharacterized protein n=1 Tax=Peronospora matthiolae TaxID=2874970 RepID=A0AAV1THB8_9STRA
MSCDLEPADFRKQDEEEEEEEDEELMFAFEPQSDEENSTRPQHEDTPIFYSIDGVSIERPVNPIVAILEHREVGESAKASREEEIVKLEDKAAVPSVLHSRKRKTNELPTNNFAQTFHPVAKRTKSKHTCERSVTATACLMDNLSLHRTSGGQCRQQRGGTTLHDNDHKKDLATNSPDCSTSVAIPNRFQPIHWPGDASGTCSAEKDCSYSCSSSSSSSCSSSKPRTPSSLSHSCRLGVDVLSPTHVHFNDLVLHSSAGSYTGS